MSERKLDEIESMFKATTKPKLEIKEIHPIDKLGVLLDDTPQGKLAMEIASILANKIDTSLDAIISEEYYEAFDTLMDGIRTEIDELTEIAKNHIDKFDLYAKYETVLSTKIEKALNIHEEEIEEEAKLGAKLVNKLEELSSDIFVMGVPVFRTREEHEAENLGGYATKLLRERRIHSNFLLISDLAKTEFDNSILAFVSIEQQPGSIVALTKRALTLSDKDTEIQLVGMLEDKVIETLARVEQLAVEDEIDEDEIPEELDTDEDDVEISEEDIEDDDEIEGVLDLEGSEKKLRDKMMETLDSIDIDEEIIRKSFNYEIKSGSIASVVNTAIDEYDPGMVLVRSVGQIEENLDPIAEQVTRIVLRSGKPCLLVWD